MIAAHEVIREGVPDSEEKGIDRIKNDDYFSSIIKTFALYKFHVLKLIENVMRERGDGGILIILVNTRKFSLLFKRRKIQRQFNEPIFSIWYPVSGIYLTTSRS